MLWLTTTGREEIQSRDLPVDPLEERQPTRGFFLEKTYGGNGTPTAADGDVEPAAPPDTTMIPL